LITQYESEREVVVHKPLAVDPAFQVREDWLGLVGGFDGAGSTDRATHTPAALHAWFLLLGRDQATAERACRVLTLVFLAVFCAPVIDQVFTHEWFAAVGAAGSDLLAITLGVIGRSLVQVETCIADGLMARRAEEVLRVPGGSQGCDIASPDGLTALLADRL